MYPIKDMRRAVEAQEKAVAKARKTGQKWREEKNAACTQIVQKKKAIDDLCMSKYSRRKTPITSTFECKSTGLVKTRPMVYDPGYVPFLGERGEVQLAPSVKIDRCLLFPSPRLPTNCDGWHRLR
jgi:hypothetical protein